ncbi:protein THEM6-like isoform X3 [Erpetoichthys calabaricus]|uniref:Protein THEM6 n=1 Tax=Erpetoichthys calabaricus TaxID=27687 RepID=A0A8C4SIC5_ERPCA|nr:protein THEM6-like isoform X3 [Erpetoichthys calabaricus]
MDVSYFFRGLYVYARGHLRSPTSNILQEQTLGGRVLATDVDFFGHMNNGRYLRQCDLGRIDVNTRNGILKTAQALGANLVVGASTIRYRRSLKFLEPYKLRTRFIAWDDKAFYLEQRFLSARDGFVCAVMLCQQNVSRSTPDKIMQHLCKRKVESPDFPEELQHWIKYNTANSKKLKAEQEMEEKLD